MKSLVSIIVPIYNVEKYIGECLESLFSQSYSHIEYVFVNDATPDRSMNILNSYINRYNIVDKCVVFNNSSNLGLAATRINGIKSAHGDYLMFLDSDDTLSTNAVEALLQCAESRNADIVESNMQFNMDSGYKILKRNKKDSVRDYLYSYISFGAPPSLMGKLYRRGLFDNVEELFLVGRDFIEDTYATPMLYCKASVIANIDIVTYFYRANNMSSHSHGAKWKKIEDLKFAINRFEEIFCCNEDSFFADAIKEAKYKIKSAYYPIYGNNERKEIIKLFPEINLYIKEKIFFERLRWWLLMNDCLFLYRVSNLIRKIFNK